MGAPILQVEIGIFGSHSQKDLQLAILHPRRLVTYSVQAVPTEDGGSDTFFQLSLLHKHSLNRSAYNFTYGGFGGAQGKDLIAVQSLDGEITIIEQDRMSFSVFLPNFLVPGPICYVPYPNDVFVTVNSQLEVEAFKYSVLGSMSSGTISADDEKAKENKRARADWSLCIGESAAMICTAKHSAGLKASQYDVSVMGEHTLFWLKESGGLRAQKRLDYNPVAMLPYSAGPGGAQNLLVASDQGILLVYGSGLQLLWAAALDAAPVTMGICNAPSIKGLVASIAEKGQLTLTYMGTDPPTQVVNASDQKALNYEQMDEEHRHLLTVRSLSSSTRSPLSVVALCPALCPLVASKGSGSPPPPLLFLLLLLLRRRRRRQPCALTA
jgi:Bardet-Biedl syndrome 9 protein